MSEKKYCYDEKCHELAEYFLADKKHTDGDVQELAQAIQDAVEMMLTDTEDVA